MPLSGSVALPRHGKRSDRCSRRPHGCRKMAGVRRAGRLAVLSSDRETTGRDREEIRLQMGWLRWLIVDDVPLGRPQLTHGPCRDTMSVMSRSRDPGARLRGEMVCPSEDVCWPSRRCKLPKALASRPVPGLISSVDPGRAVSVSRSACRWLTTSMAMISAATSHWPFLAGCGSCRQ